MIATDACTTEKAIAFGAENALVGTITIPGLGADTESDLGFIFFNAGVVHRVGPHRINVKLARAVARLGIPSIRFDLAGLGDSGRQGMDSRLSYGQQAAVDIYAAIDALAAHTQAKRFVLCAICSGTVHSYAAAENDSRIAALILLDGYRYPSARMSFVYLMTRIRRRMALGGLTSWIGESLRARIARLTGSHSPTAQQDDVRVAGPGFFTDRPTKREFAMMLNGFAQRNIRVFFVYAGSTFQYYNYANQFKDAFKGYGLSPLVEDHFLPYADHTMTRRAAQQEFVALVTDWTSTRLMKVGAAETF